MTKALAKPMLGKPQTESTITTPSTPTTLANKINL